MNRGACNVVPYFRPCRPRRRVTETQRQHLYLQGRHLGFDGSFVNVGEKLFVVWPPERFGESVYVDSFERTIVGGYFGRMRVPFELPSPFGGYTKCCLIYVVDVISTRRGVWVTAALRLQRFFRRRMYERKRWPLVVADAMEIAKCYARGAGRFVRTSEIEASWLESIMIRDYLWKGSANRQAHLTKEMTRRRRVKERTPEQQLPEQQLQGNYARVMAT